MTKGILYPETKNNDGLLIISLSVTALMTLIVQIETLRPVSHVHTIRGIQSGTKKATILVTTNYGKLVRYIEAAPSLT